jgi:maltose-binding protein MalE
VFILSSRRNVAAKIRRKMKSKKVVALALTLGFAASSLLALPASAEEKVITVWADESRGPNLTTVLGKLENQKGGEWVPGHKIKVQAFSSFDALKLAVDNVTKDGPDIIVGANDWVATGAANGKLAPFTPSAAVRKAFNANNWFDLTYKGKIYGVPVDVNNVAMLVNTKLTGNKKPETFGDMVKLYTSTKTKNKLVAGLCVAGGGMSFGAHPVISALGGNAYTMFSGKVNSKATPVPAAVATNIQKNLLGANGKSNGFFPATDTGCKDNFLAGKVPYAIIGNWEWKDYTMKGFSMNNLMSVPGITKGKFGSAFGSVSGALLTSFAKDNGNDAAAKSLLTRFFASTGGQVLYQNIEQRPPANKEAASQAGAAQKGFGNAAAVASIPQIGNILNGAAGGTSYWDALPAFWDDVLVKNIAPKTAVTKLNAIFVKNRAAGLK